MPYAVAFLVSLACTEDVTKDKTAATVVDPGPTVATPPPPPAAGPGLPFDAATSSVKVHAAKVTKAHDIVFTDVSGTYTLEGEVVRTLRVVVKTAALTTDSEKLATHLRGPDFLNVEVIPEANFAGEVTLGGIEGKGSHTVKGKLNLHGVEKELSFPATIEVTPAQVRGQAEFSINRHDFGIAYPGKPDDLLQDGVVFSVNLVSNR